MNLSKKCQNKADWMRQNPAPLYIHTRMTEKSVNTLYLNGPISQANTNTITPLSKLNGRFYWVYECSYILYLYLLPRRNIVYIRCLLLLSGKKTRWKTCDSQFTYPWPSPSKFFCRYKQQVAHMFLHSLLHLVSFLTL